MVDDIVARSFTALYPEKEWTGSGRVRYSRRFKGWNANLGRRGNEYVLSLAHSWKGVSPDILIGLCQDLLGRLSKNPRMTVNKALYHSFLKNVGKYQEKNTPPLELLNSFDRVNAQYFDGLMERPSIQWCDGVARVGYYDYTTDTVSVSRETSHDLHVMDYVMYHELLHKKHSVKRGNKLRTVHHSRSFREDEHLYENWKDAEKKLSMLGRKRRLWGVF